MARWCARNGWPVHPLAPNSKIPAANCDACRTGTHSPRQCPCRAAGRWCHGFHAATTDPARIDAWWGSTPGLGVGVSCGPAGLVVIDVDAHQVPVPDRDRLLPGIPIHESIDLTGLASGFDTLALLAAYREHPDPAQDASTLRIRTPSGGLHIWYRTTRAEARYRSSTGSSTKVALAWQVDVRAEGGYIVAPGTRTPAGEYRAIGTTRLPAPLPTWLAAELDRTGHPVTPPPTKVARSPRAAAPKASRRALDALLAEVEACAATPEGAGFTEKLNRAAYTAGGLVAAGRAREDRIREVLLAAARSARPRQEHRNATIVASALSAGMLRPLHPRGRS
ncbi:bifunctional DNA primase/polymerase [Embleya hyalina]|uniref:bifunctional DNA primase/polymerase n=1 Tax=Embleya hyalina TaxID=516124 RepID=UPI000F8224B2|nr:bifunctional DNA primase/polymerase [Embleya hyalina]